MSVDLDKLAKVTSMISSPSDGEALSAARKADQMVKEAGLTWSDVIGPGQARPAEPPKAVTVKGKLTVVRESVTTKGDPMAMLSVTSTEATHQDLIAFGRLATWIADSVRAMPQAIFQLQITPPTPGFRYNKVASCIRT